MKFPSKIHWYLSVCIFAVLACGDESVDYSSSQLEKDLSTGQMHLQHERFQHAEAMFTRILEHEPQHPKALHGLAQVLIETKDYRKALPLLEQALASDSENAEIQVSAGRCYAALEKYTEAAKAYGHAFHLQPQQAVYGLKQGKNLKKSKAWKEAEEILQSVAKLDPYIEFVYTELADVLREQGKLEQALIMYMKAQTIHPGDRMAHAGAAMVYEQKNQLAHAIDEWAAYIRMDCCSDYSKNVAQVTIASLRERYRQD